MKNWNRTLLEMWIGMLLYGVPITLLLVFIPAPFIKTCIGLWLGILVAAAATVHMYRTLEKGLDLDEGNAQKKIFFGYIQRYIAFCIIIIAAGATGILHPLAVFVGLMSLKGAVYFQPFTHKILLKLFSEEEPALEELEPQEALEVEENTQ